MRGECRKGGLANSRREIAVKGGEVIFGQSWKVGQELGGSFSFNVESLKGHGLGRSNRQRRRWRSRRCTSLRDVLSIRAAVFGPVAMFSPHVGTLDTYFAAWS